MLNNRKRQKKNRAWIY